MTRRDRCYECGESMVGLSQRQASEAWFRLADRLMTLENHPNPKFKDLLYLMNETAIQAKTLAI